MMFFLIMVTPGIIVIPVIKELGEHLLNVVKTSYWALEVCSWASNRRQRSSLSLSAIFTDTLSVRTELTVAEEAYPLSSSSSSDHWNNFLIGSGEVTVVEEDGCS